VPVKLQLVDREPQLDVDTNQGRESHVRSTSPQKLDRLEHLPIAELETMPAPYNARDVTEDELARLRASIVYFGKIDPMLINTRTQHIVDGHQRLKAAKAEGAKTFPVTYVDVDLTTEMEMNASLNTNRGHWVDVELSAMLQELKERGGDLSKTGFTDEELQAYLVAAKFDPVGADDQPRLDMKKPVVCPECGNEFTP